jgi:hypothetical protein
VQRGRAAGLELGDPALAHALGGDGAQAEFGERGAQVQAGSADDDRPPALGEQAVDLGVGQLGVLTGAEGGIDWQEGDEPVLEPGALARAGPAGERLEPDVDLEGIGRDRDRGLPHAAQPVGQRDGDVGLADAGGSEQRNDLGGSHALSIVQQ